MAHRWLPAGQKTSGAVYSYFVGPQSQWNLNRSSYSELAYRNVWPGVDAVFKGADAGLKYQFELAAGADAKRVVLRIAGAQTLRVAANGAMEWSVNGSVFRDEAPIAYQMNGKRRVKVTAEYVVKQVDASTWLVGFALGQYDSALPLVIDPAWAAPAGLVGAGGVFLALAADQVWVHEGVVLNPHYKNMGNLYGSEYWTYLLPRRLGEAGARELMAGRLPLRAADAQRLGLIDACDEGPREGYENRAIQRALALAASTIIANRWRPKQARRAADEAHCPLARYREQELARMHRNFYGFDPSYHVARHHFVHKLPHAWTPRHLATHR